MSALAPVHTTLALSDTLSAVVYNALCLHPLVSSPTPFPSSTALP